jgi:hypothetical protein
VGEWVGVQEGGWRVPSEQMQCMGVNVYVLMGGAVVLPASASASCMTASSQHVFKCVAWCGGWVGGRVCEEGGGGYVSAKVMPGCECVCADRGGEVVVLPATASASSMTANNWSNMSSNWGGGARGGGVDVTSEQMQDLGVSVYVLLLGGAKGFCLPLLPPCLFRAGPACH